MHPINALLKKAIKKGIFKKLRDESYLKLLYRVYMGKPLHLTNPVTYNEKLQWLKLYDRNPLYTKMVDKYEAKNYVADQIGKEYITPTLGVWNHPEDIDFDLLPDRFVLKTTHDSGGIIIVDKKTGYDRNKINLFFNERLSHSTYEIQREWPYRNVPKRIIAEQYMEDEKTHELRDYKFFCFDGEVKAMFIATDRQSDKPTAFDFFDPDFNWLDIRHGHPNAEIKPEKPINFELMKRLSAKLSEGFPQVRVDLYEINGKVYFGELTFFHHGGIVPFDPEKWDRIFGEWIKLPDRVQKEG